jgi:hypothetical protein
MEKQITHGNFNTHFEENLRRVGSHKKAYDETSQQYQAETGEERYSSYESFKSAWYRRVRKKQNRK